ncbi:MAG: hypothetical protein QN157_09545 [Armatimonadota bacterium]|nr:hypothetical protein [Armatimonadota bacterium]
MYVSDEQALATALVTLAHWAGQPLDDDLASQVVPIVAGALRDWIPLARAVAPEAEPLWYGRWPEEAGDD